MNERFRDLLPWYVNGTLSAEDKAWVENYLRQHPESERELRWYRVLRDETRDIAPKVPETIGWAGVSARIKAERPGALQRLRHILFGGADEGAQPGGALRLRPGLAIAGFALLVLQGGVIVGLVHERDEAENAAIRAGATEPARDGPLLAIVFSSEITEKDLRLMLVDVRGTLVGGPGQLGKYYVRVPKGTEQSAVDTLKSRPRVDSVELVPGVPPAH